MTHEEVLAWQQYAKKHGNLSIHARLELGFAMLCMAVNRAVGGKAELDDFMPHTKREEPAASIDGVFGMLKAQSVRKK